MMTNRPASVAPYIVSPGPRPFLFGPLFLAFLPLLSLPGPAFSTEAVLVGLHDNPPLLLQDQIGQVRGMAIGLLENIAGQDGWLWIVMLAGAALLLIFFGTTLLLRARVHRKTRELRQRNTDLRREIQDRLQAQQESMRSETKYRLVVDYANEAIFLLQNGMVKFPNPKTEAMLGYSERELAALPFLNLVHPDDRDMVRDKIKALEQGEALTSTYAFRLINQAGKELSVQQNDVFTTWENQPTVLCFLRDISAQMRMEAQMLQAQRMEAVGTLAGGVAHDFNNLLTGIQGRAALMLMNIDASHPHYRDLREIEAISKSAENLTRQLLGFARGGKYEVAALDLNALIADTLTMFGRTRKGLDLHKHLGEALPAVEADRGQIGQVFLNLFVNASQAMPTGGSITVETKDIRLHEEFVRPHQVRPGKFVKVTVTDTGSGMDEATRQRIFDPFFTTKSRERGTGLGLASVYGIVKNHGGIITVKSDKGRGTTFTIFLPASDKMARPERPHALNAVRGEGTILLVDDEKMIVEAGRLMLQTLGYTVLTAYNGMEALSIFKARHADIDLVLLDIIMPGLEGHEVFQAMHAIKPEVKVLLASGYSIKNQTQKILEAGCSGFIQKPFSIKELSVKIQEILKGARNP